MTSGLPGCGSADRGHPTPSPTWSACAAIRPGLFPALATVAPFVLFAAECRPTRTGIAPLPQACLATLARTGRPIGDVGSRSPTPVW
jgi:hypothetical protein